MATSSTIQINISLYMFLAQFLLKKKTFFLSASALIFFPRNGVTSTTRPKPLKKPSQHAQASTSSPGTMYSTTRPKPLKKPSGGANLQSSQQIWISGACETKLGCVLSFLENATRRVSREMQHDCLQASTFNISLEKSKWNSLWRWRLH